MIILKLGGSIITDKSKKYCFKQKIMDDLARETKKAEKNIILVHGAGSFGHILAKKYNLNQGYSKSDQIIGFAQTQLMVQKLNTMLLEHLQNHGINAISIPPHSILQLDDHKPIKTNLEIFKEYLKKGFTPVTFGDVVLDLKLGFSICSGDLLVEILTEHYKPEKVIFAIDEDGLFTSNPKIDENAEFIESTTVDQLEKLSTSLDAHADVTGGMKGKIDTIKKIAGFGVDTFMVNGKIPDRLYKTLIGEETRGTKISGGKKL